jgi:hypothetical protein
VGFTCRDGAPADYTSCKICSNQQSSRKDATAASTTTPRISFVERSLPQMERRGKEQEMWRRRRLQEREEGQFVLLCGGGADDGSSPSQLLDLEEVLSCGRRPKEMVATSHRTSALEPAGGCLRSRLRARWRDLHLHPCPEPASSPAPKPTGGHLHPRPRARRRPPPRQRLRREEEMDAVREGGEARDLGRAGGSAMVTDSVEDGACGAEGEEKSRWGQSHGRVKPRLLRTEFCSPFHSF